MVDIFLLIEGARWDVNGEIIIRFLNAQIPIGQDGTPAVDDTVIGTLSSQINCNVSQLSRSLDNHYSERYYVVTNFEVDRSRRNLYLVPIKGYGNSGLHSDIAGMKVERLFKLNDINILICQTYPDRIGDIALNYFDFEFIDSLGNTRQIVVPSVITE